MANFMRILAMGFILQLMIPIIPSFKILIATPEIGSHMMLKVIIGKTLVSKGHEVYIVLSNKYPDIEKIKKQGIKTIEYKVPDDTVLLESEESKKYLGEIISSGRSTLEFDKFVSRNLHKYCEYLMNDTETLNVIRRHEFDLFLVEPFILCPCNILLPAYIGKPFITLCNMYSFLDIRAPALPSFVSAFDAPVSTDNLGRYGLKKKLWSVFANVLITNPQLIFEHQKTDLIIKYAPEFGSWQNITRQSQLFLVEIDYHVGGFVPQLPNFVNVAGLTITPTKPLPENLELLMSESGSNGVILVSFGSYAYYLPKEAVQKFMEAFSVINQTVIARFAVPDGITVPPNVKLVDWIPQNDILGHPKTRLFITHCGNNGQYEALHYSVPLIAFPMFAEQHINAIGIVERGYGISMEILNFAAHALISNIQEVIYNETYSETTRKASEKWKDQYNREPPLDRAAFWVEHVIKHGGRHLRSPSLDQSLFEFLMVDIIVMFLLVLILLVLCVCGTVKLIVKLVCRTRKVKKLKIKQP